jgi:hypothetical protein
VNFPFLALLTSQGRDTLPTPWQASRRLISEVEKPKNPVVKREQFGGVSIFPLESGAKDLLRVS